MATISGSRLVAKALKDQGAEVVFFLTGGPIIGAAFSCTQYGIKMVDVHHEQAAAMAAHGWGRVKGKPGVCMAAAGPGVTNLVTGVAAAYMDCFPLVVLGGSSAIRQEWMEAFQEIDQVAMMKPITKWAARVTRTERIPEYIAMAFRHAQGGRPGPVYLDLPGDILNSRAEDTAVNYPPAFIQMKPQGNPESVAKAVELLSKAERPIIVSGTGVLLSHAASELKEFSEKFGIPAFTTPQGRGVIPEDHPLCPTAARSFAFREADVVLTVGTRFNFVISFGRSPRFAKDAKMIQVDIDAEHIGNNRPVEVGIVGDAGMVLRQLIDMGKGIIKNRADSAWVKKLQDVNKEKQSAQQAIVNSDQIPMHPARMCKEIGDFMDRDAILTVDGNVTLNWGRQVIPTYQPGHRLNCGPFGCLGVGIPFGIGAKVAKPDKQVIVLNGDGAFGLNAMEMHTAVKHNLPIIVVINNNSGWDHQYEDPKAGAVGSFIGDKVRYDQMVATLGGYGELVEKPQDIRPALERAAASGKPACINIITDKYVAGETLDFYGYAL
ncbi:MAG: thiamine pyrophosphate-binding protein [Dehalococcoidia bacterium]|nr:thiamine pyrophosphate-binding protein [Dehalococcoidia bacterium]